MRPLFPAVSLLVHSPNSAAEKGAKVGEHVVRIAGKPPESIGDCCEPPGDFTDPVPAKYNAEAAKNPEMTKNVVPGNNTFNFDLKPGN